MSATSRFIALLPLGLLAVAWIGQAAITAPIQFSPNFAAIDQYVVAEMAAARIPGLALAVVQDGQVVHLQGFGTADSSGRPVTPQTPFMIASTVKVFTALAVMEQVDSGQIDLDAPVQRYLPWFQVADPAASAQITVRHLLTHTSGIPEAAGNEIPVNTDLGDRALEERVRRLKSVGTSSPAGARFQYSSANYDTLGLIVQTVSGRSYERYLQENIFDRLDMRNSYTSVGEAAQNGLASGYRSLFGFPFVFPTRETRAYIPSGWTASSSVEDLAHFAAAILNDGHYGSAASLNVSPGTLAAMQEPLVQSYNETTFAGLGWTVSTINGYPVISAGGDAMNYKSRLVLLPQQRLAVVVVMNMNSVNVNSLHFEIHRGVLNLLLGQQPAPVQAHNMQVFVPMLAVLLASLFFLIGIIRILVRRKHRTRLDSGSTKSSLLIGLPTGFAAAWTLLLLFGFPQVSGRSLPFLLLYIPDLGYIIIVGAVTALTWGIIWTVDRLS